MSELKVGDRALVTDNACGDSWEATIIEVDDCAGYRLSSWKDSGRPSAYRWREGEGGMHFEKIEEEESMDNLQPGTVLVSKSSPEKDSLLVLGTFEYNGETVVACLDVYDRSLDRDNFNIDYIRNNYYVKGQVPEKTEVTLEEVAEKMGVPVEQLRIKD